MCFRELSPTSSLAERELPVNASRRDFLKLTTIGGAAAAVFGFDLQPAYAQLRTLKIARANETRSTCPYCAVGCGTIIYTIGDRAKNVTAQVVHVEAIPIIPRTAALSARRVPRCSKRS